MTVRDVYEMTARSFVFVREPDETLTEFYGQEDLADKNVIDIHATRYPMYDHVLEVEVSD